MVAPLVALLSLIRMVEMMMIMATAMMTEDMMTIILHQD